MEEEKNELSMINPVFEKNSTYRLYIIFVILIIVAALLYIYIDRSEPTITMDKQTATCIAEKSELYVLDTCGACKNQKKILGEYLELFNMIECTENPTLCSGITVVPTWIINGKKHIGVQSVNNLKEITGC